MRDFDDVVTMDELRAEIERLKKTQASTITLTFLANENARVTLDAERWPGVVDRQEREDAALERIAAALERLADRPVT